MGLLSSKQHQELCALPLPMANVEHQIEQQIIFQTDAEMNFMRENGQECTPEDRAITFEMMSQLFLPTKQACRAVIGQGITHASIKGKPSLHEVTERMIGIVTQSEGEENFPEGFHANLYRNCVRHALSELFLVTRPREDLESMLRNVEIEEAGADHRDAARSSNGVLENHGGELASSTQQQAYNQFIQSLSVDKNVLIQLHLQMLDEVRNYI